MTRWLVPILLFLVVTLLAVGLGWGANYGLGSAIALGDGETLDRVRIGAGGADPATAAPDSGAAVAAVEAAPTPRGLTRRQYIDAILARNIFDSTNIGNPGDDSDNPCEGEDCEYANSDLPVRLIATAVATQAMLSAALIEEENSKDYAGYGVGDKLLDSTILAIEWDRVIVKRADGAEEVILAREESGSTKSSSPVSSGNATDDGIVKEDDENYTISRELVDSTLADLDSVSKMARARPHKDSDGKTDGFRLSGVRRNQMLYKIGIRSGDVVHSVNGQPLTSMQEAMGAWQGMQNGSGFSFDITRRGQKKTMNYTIK
ncbi:MAG: type II secretion system protein GspC [Myxococcota bacterium]